MKKMKKSTLIRFVGMLFITLTSACATTPSYFGKTYTATQNVDVYLDAAGVKKTHTIMGTSEFDEEKSLEATQEKVIEMGKAKGADGVIMKLTEEVVATQQNGTGIVNKKTKNNTISTSSTAVDVKINKIAATFIKYN